MMRNVVWITTVTILVLLLGLGWLQAQDKTSIPWDRIPDADKLTSAQKAVAEAVLCKAECYAACMDTVANCLTQQPEQAHVKRLAAFIVRRARTGQDETAVMQDVRDRALSAYPPKLYNADLTGLVPSGKPGAPIRIVIFADFQCPYCGIAAPALRRLVKEMPEKLVLYYKHYPLKTHPQAVQSALAALAAERQGKFWEMHDILYANRDDLSDEALLRYAAKIGLDVERFKADIADKALLERLRAEKTEGRSFGMEGTPGIFINGKFYRGDKSYEELLDRIQEEQDILDGRQ